ncbi:hypothetical protein BCR37DRAFT_378472 [Protomyces lactucae-debilis]|uniref:Oxysterol-binding protein n=1 Tax=Protomyces lactucae-debilis TaxID=2754530 RepID=A0A1Y2FP03_PROLT|nr:uncharacterized protein BCR37DRAFT_378472 [Protomyces lactucae-debilis]ORY84445.1 hypothetical protein BCR37DRAFT_378472 [Protomyces lactucae-debilis]
MSSENIPAEVAAADEAVAQGDTGKFKLILSILRQFIGVKDMANVRFSLPAQLIEPIPNLEYWNYCDRPDYFVAMDESDDALERMLAVLRWYLTKDLKLVHGKICKPYNSVLGEYFRCRWTSTSVPLNPVTAKLLEGPAEPAATASKASRFKPSFGRRGTSTATLASVSAPPTRPVSPTGSTKSTNSGVARDITAPLQKPIQTAFLCEQTSHHPPVSAYIYSCPEKQIEAVGMDQIAAKFTGTTIKVEPGELNEGIFVKLKKRNEEYRCTHPTATICGFLRGTLYTTIQDSAVITCKQTGLRTIIIYKDEPWIGKPKFQIEGLIFRYNQDEDEDIVTCRDVPEEAIVAKIEGSWKGKYYISSPKSAERHVLLDVTDLLPVTKTVPPMEQQQINESRVVWDPVTKAILARDFVQATRNKTEIEDLQRTVAKERAAKEEPFVPVYFQVNGDGRPTLTEAGRRTLLGQFDATS